MEYRRGESNPPFAGVSELVVQMQQHLPAQQAAWVRQLNQKPGGFADLERTIHHDFHKMAVQVVARLLAEVTDPTVCVRQPIR